MDDAGAKPPKMPRWVKVFGIIGIAVVVLALVVLVFGGSQHGPGRHASPSGNDDSASPQTGGNHTPPTTHHGNESYYGEAGMVPDPFWLAPGSRF